jgi:hypothetical protein
MGIANLVNLARTAGWDLLPLLLILVFAQLTHGQSDDTSNSDSGFTLSKTSCGSVGGCYANGFWVTTAVLCIVFGNGSTFFFTRRQVQAEEADRPKFVEHDRRVAYTGDGLRSASLLGARFNSFGYMAYHLLAVAVSRLGLVPIFIVSEVYQPLTFLIIVIVLLLGISGRFLDLAETNLQVKEYFLNQEVWATRGSRLQTLVLVLLCPAALLGITVLLGCNVNWTSTEGAGSGFANLCSGPAASSIYNAYYYTNLVGFVLCWFLIAADATIRIPRIAYALARAQSLGGSTAASTRDCAAARDYDAQQQPAPLEGVVVAAA